MSDAGWIKRSCCYLHQLTEKRWADEAVAFNTIYTLDKLTCFNQYNKLKREPAHLAWDQYPIHKTQKKKRDER